MAGQNWSCAKKSERKGKKADLMVVGSLGDVLQNHQWRTFG